MHAVRILVVEDEAKDGGVLYRTQAWAQNGLDRAPRERSATGQGSRRSIASAIFERFYRVDPARSRGAGGLGLGLAIARSTVEVNGGRIEVESGEGHGSIFRVVLPCGRDRLEPSPPAADLSK